MKKTVNPFLREYGRNSGGYLADAEERFTKMIAINLLLSVVCANEAYDYHALTPEEERIIVHKGTEHPFTGIYDKHFKQGIYLCKRCNEPLYRSESKFDSGCGWPSFDDAISGAVQHAPDVDGRRTEILCARCNAHLGHVFFGEGFTPKNTRHCVNSISLNFAASQENGDKITTAQAIFAGGCFWGVEYFFQEAEGVLKTRVGYTGGKTENPTYQEVCNGDTGHAEAVEVVYDSTKTTYETLTRLFFEIHDPTQTNRQGPDVGEQYRSAIFYLDESQYSIALKIIEELRERGYAAVTQVIKADKFWPAEEYHQQYYRKKNGRPYCHAYHKRF